MSQPDIPAYSDLLWPTIVAVRRLGGSGSIDEIAEAAVDQEGFAEEQQQVLHSDGPQTEIEYRLAGARSYPTMPQFTAVDDQSGTHSVVS